jgi:hypothetical protein
MSNMTRYEFETFVLGAEPTVNRKALVLDEYAKKTPNTMINQVKKEFVEKHGKLEQLIADVEKTEETYWVQKLAKIAAIDILTNGKVQPENMERITCLSEKAFVDCIKNATLLAHDINSRVMQVESDLTN